MATVQVNKEKFLNDRMVKFYRTTEELNTPEVSELKGEKLPPWVSGTYLRTGPGIFDLKDDFVMKHWFDGYAVVSKFQIADGKVKFQKKYLQSDAYKRAMASGKPCICEYATRAYTDPSKGIMTRIFNTISPEFSDNANISLFNIGQNVFVSGETSFFHELNISNLSATHRYDTNKLFGINAASAHPLTDETGTMYNIGTIMAPLTKYVIIKIPPSNGSKDSKEILKKGKILCSIPPRWNRNTLSYNHSFGVTKNYIVFIEQPYVLSLTKILGSALTKGQSFRDWVEWKPEYTNRFYIIDKETGKIVSNTEIYSQQPFFFAHFISCYEDQGQVVMNMFAYSDPEILETQFIEKLRLGEKDTEETRAAGTQFVIPIEVDKKKTPEDENLVTIPGSKATAYRKGSHIIVTPEIVSEKGLEFPTINKKYTGRKHRFYYASGLTTSGRFENSLCKVNMDTKEIVTYKDDENYVYGEPVFIPNPDVDYSDISNEDNGVLLCPMTDYRIDACDMIVFIDPKTMKQIARSEFKTQVPPAVHGLFVPSF